MTSQMNDFQMNIFLFQEADMEDTVDMGAMAVVMGKLSFELI